MEFYDVVGHVLELLQRQERVSYRALKRQFSIDDDYIEDLKEEIIYAQQVARDEDNRVLVWVSDTDSATDTLATPSITEPATPQTTEPEREPASALYQRLLSGMRHAVRPPASWADPQRRGA